MKLLLSCAVSLVLLSHFKYSKANQILINHQHQPPTNYQHEYKFVDKPGAYYKLHCRPRPWVQAVQVCALEGATLLTPKDTTELAAVLPIISNQKNLIIWLGYHSLQKKTDQSFYPITDETNYALNWGPGQPAKGFKHCVIAYNTGLYGAEHCGTNILFVCKRNSPPHPDDSHFGTDYSIKKGYTYSPNTKAYYKYHANPSSWVGALKTCAEEGAMLASPKDKDEIKDLLLYVPKDVKLIWIGVHCLYSDRVFKQLNYEDHSPYLDWDSQTSEPNNAGGREECVEMYAREFKNYNDIRCDKSSTFVCKIDEFTSSLLRRIMCCVPPELQNDSNSCTDERSSLIDINVSNSA